jgi:AcrR family transcriptional regulator
MAVGLRERKKEQTRRLIADTARRLFAERGFDRVTVAEVAREADVAEKTVFNYFATKEDLFYSGLESFEADLLEAIRAREEGETVLAAFRRFLLQPRGLFAADDPKEATERMNELTRVITGSPALLAREQQIYERYTRSLAELIADEAGSQDDDLQPWVAANALMGVHRAAIEYTRRRTLAGADVKSLARDYRARAEAAFALLEGGLGGMGVKRGAA